MLLKLNREKLQAKQMIEAFFALHFKLLYPMKIRHCTFAILLVFCACSAQKQLHNEIASVEKKKKTKPQNSLLLPNISSQKKTGTPVDTALAKQEFSSEFSSAKFNHKKWDSLVQQHVSSDGKVDYKGFKKDVIYLEVYLQELSKNVPKDDQIKEEKLAYWMNAYNAFTIKLIIDNYPLKSIKDIKEPWKRPIAKIDNKWYSLNDIEHNILRKMNDPRIHFGINCASYSCAPLWNRAFTAADVEMELEALTKRFINDRTRNKISSDHMQLSKIFQWFAKDFKKKGSLVAFLNHYASTPIHKNAKKSFLKYNWSLNE
jgi:hypothetical protein